MHQDSTTSLEKSNFQSPAFPKQKGSPGGSLFLLGGTGFPDSNGLSQEITLLF
jgi:hypothetical protein